MDGLALRPVEPGDFEQLWFWRNDPHTRRMERTAEVVSRAHYEAWLESGVISPIRQLYMAEMHGISMGLCELALGRDGVAGIGINLSPDWRGRRLATPIIRASLHAAQKNLGFSRVTADIRAENIPSYRAFVGAGFQNDQITGSILRLRRDFVSDAYSEPERVREGLRSQARGR